MNNPVISAIYKRRVTRFFSRQPIAREDLETIVAAGRWAPSSGNRRLQRFVVVTDADHIRYIRMMAPGISGFPAAIIVVCTDLQEAERQGYPPNWFGAFIDAGMAAQNMLLAASALGIGAGPATSYSKAAIRVITEMPEWLSPDLVICLGYPGAQGRGGNVRPAKAMSWRDITYWERCVPDDKGSDDRERHEAFEDRPADN